MSNNKQSSGIDFYRSSIIKITADGLSKRITGEQWDLLERKEYEQAKAMHKEGMIQNCAKMQIINDVDFDGNVTFIFDPEQYYNETYGGNK